MSLSAMMMRSGDRHVTATRADSGGRKALLFALIAVALLAASSAGATTPFSACGAARSDLSSQATATCGGLKTYLDGPWVYKAGECRFCGGQPAVRWRVRRLRLHQTVAFDFGITGTARRFADAQGLTLRLPGMVIRKGSSANPGTGDAGPKVAYRRDTYVLTLTPSFHKYGGPNMGGIGDQLLAAVADPTVSRVCPEITVRFTDRTLTYKPGCLKVKPR